MSKSCVSLFLGISERTARNYEVRFGAGLELWDAPRSGCKRLYDQAVADRFITFYCQSSPLPKSKAGRWSLTTATKEIEAAPTILGAVPSRATLHRMLIRHGLKPHRVRYFLHVTDPDFFPKMARLTKLYASRQKYLFCFDECPGIQVLKRIAPDMRPDGDDDALRQWLSEFEYARGGTIDLFAFLQVCTGKVCLAVRDDHKKATFIDLFCAHVAEQPTAVRLDYVLDNLDSHCSYDFCVEVARLSDVKCPSGQALSTRQLRREWLQREDKRIVLHFTPFHGSWLNMVEIFFRIMGQTCLKDSYDDPDQMCAALLEYAEQWNEKWARPFNWSYTGEGLPEKVVRRFTRMLKSSASKMTLQFATKECLLMVNVMAEHWEVVGTENWEALFEAFEQAESTLRQIVTASEQPIVKKRAADALGILSQTIAAKRQGEALAA